MEAFAAPIRALVAEASWFARAKEVRLFHVVTSADLADGALGVLMGQEFHADNRSLFSRIDDPFALEDHGWATRAVRLREQHGKWRDALADAGIQLGALPPPFAAPEPVAAFATQVRQVVDSLAPPLEGLVVVLAPTRIDDPEAWAVSLRGLITAPRLQAVRWIAVTREEAASGPITRLIQSLGVTGLSARCVPDQAAVDRELADMLDRAAAAPQGSSGPALVGAAWPTVRPPRRLGRPELTEPEQKAALIAAGVEPPITVEEGRGLRSLILGAAQALKAGRGPEAVRLQREARDRCEALGMPKEAILMELTLASYLVYLGHRPRAVETYQNATARAETLNLPKEAAQAQLALGALYLVDKRQDQAAVAYARAGRLAQQAEVPLLAIEAFRLCGTYTADTRLKIEAWQKALVIAGGLDPPEAKESSAAEAARALAAQLRKLGLHPQAAHVEDQSVALEAGTPLVGSAA